MALNIGKLRHRITIEQKTQVPDGGGGWEEGWTSFATVWASVEPISGKEFFEAQQTQSAVTHKIRIRYRPGILSSMRINFKGRIFEIVSPPINLEERNKEILLMCSEVATGG